MCCIPCHVTYILWYVLGMVSFFRIGFFWTLLPINKVGQKHIFILPPSDKFICEYEYFIILKSASWMLSILMLQLTQFIFIIRGRTLPGRGNENKKIMVPSGEWRFGYKQHLGYTIHSFQDSQKNPRYNTINENVTNISKVNSLFY